MINTLINWDCIQELKNIPDNSIDLVLTDPPYWMSFVSERRNEWSKHKAIENDDSLEWIDDFLIEIKRVSKDRETECYGHYIITL